MSISVTSTGEAELGDLVRQCCPDRSSTCDVDRSRGEAEECPRGEGRGRPCLLTEEGMGERPSRVEERAEERRGSEAGVRGGANIVRVAWGPLVVLVPRRLNRAAR